MAKKICPRCGTENSEKATYCVRCGNTLPPEAAEPAAPAAQTAPQSPSPAPEAPAEPPHQEPAQTPPQGNYTYGGQNQTPPQGNYAYGGQNQTPPQGNYTYGGQNQTPPQGNYAYGGQNQTPPQGNYAYGGQNQTPPQGNYAYGCQNQTPPQASYGTYTPPRHTETHPFGQPDRLFGWFDGTFTPDAAAPARGKTAAGLLALFLGILGIHKFYLGQWGAGLLYLLATLFFCSYAVWIVGLLFLASLAEMILLLSMPPEEFQNKYHVRAL